MDPRNSTVTEGRQVLTWTAPTTAETGRFRRVIDAHRTNFAAYLRHVRGEIDLYTDEFGCAISSDTTGQFEQVTIAGREAPQDDLPFSMPDALLRRQAN